MTDVFGNTNKVTAFLPGIRRKGRIIHQIVNGLIPMELEERTNVIGGTGEHLNRDST
jgi:hypothetical protein